MRSRNGFRPNIVRYIVEGAAQESARSLELLRAIETTVDVNHMIADVFGQISGRITAAIEAVCLRPSDNPVSPVDADGSMRAAGEQALDAIEAVIERMSQKRRGTALDETLSEDDGVVESYDRVIEALTECHGLINELNWAIMEHDADRAPLSGKGPFKSAKDLLAALCE